MVALSDEEGGDEGDEVASDADELPPSHPSPPVSQPPSPARELDQQDLQSPQQDLQSPQQDVQQEAASAAATEFLRQAQSDADHVHSAAATEPLAATHVTQTAAAAGGADDDYVQSVRPNATLWGAA